MTVTKPVCKYVDGFAASILGRVMMWHTVLCHDNHLKIFITSGKPTDRAIRKMKKDFFKETW
jgi:cytidylate kinase